jgi:hypothetical protein
VTLCERCGDAFDKAHPMQRFCTKTCQQRSKDERKTAALQAKAPEVDRYKICSTFDCAALFRPRQYNQRFCSPRCGLRHFKFLRRKEDTRNCLHCDKPFVSRGENHKFCGRRCRLTSASERAAEAYRERNPAEWETCLSSDCDTKFLPTGHGKKLYCSARCRRREKKRRVRARNPGLRARERQYARAYDAAVRERKRRAAS